MDCVASDCIDEDEENVIVCIMASHQGMSRLGDAVSGLGWILAERELTQMAGDSLLVLGMATCHELNIIKDVIYGASLDEKMFSSTGWSMELVGEESKQLDQLSVPYVRSWSPRTASNTLIQAAQQKVFQFSSDMQRMSVITRVMEEGFSEPVTMVFCKGSPEMIQRLCRPETIPADFDCVLERYVSRGFRIIALASKVINPSNAKDLKLKKMTREQTEVDLEFLGLVMCQAERVESFMQIPQLDGWADVEVYCDICNHPFVGRNKNRSKQDHLINQHFQDRFRCLNIEKTDGFFSCPENCGKKSQLKMDIFRHLAGVHGKLTTLISEHIPNIQNNQEIDLESGMQADFEQPLVQLDDDGAVSTSDVDGDRHEEASGLLPHEMPSFIDNVLEKLFKTDSTDEAFTSWKEAGIPAKMVNNALIHMFKGILKNSNSDQRKTAMDLVDQLFGSDLITGVQIKESLVKIVSTMVSNSDTASQTTMAEMSVWAVLTDKLKLTEVAEITEGGASHPLFFSVLQVMASKDKEATLASIKDIKLMDQLPPSLRTEEQLGDQLEQRQLSFLVPLLAIKADMWRQLENDPCPEGLLAWIKKTVPEANKKDQGFVSTLITNIVRLISKSTTLKNNTTSVKKADTDKEKEMITEFKTVLSSYLVSPELQLVAVYALQVFCFSRSFPKGMLLRWFVALYEADIIDEHVFLNWKEDVNDLYPGKGKALYQVNNWLNQLPASIINHEYLADQQRHLTLTQLANQKVREKRQLSADDSGVFDSSSLNSSMVAGAVIKRTNQEEEDKEQKRLKTDCILHDHFYAWTPTNYREDKSVQTVDPDLRILLQSYLLGQDLMLHNQGTSQNNLVDRTLNLLNKFRQYIQLNRDTKIDAMSLHLTDKKKVTVLVEAPILMSDKAGSSTSNDYNTDLPSYGQINPDDQSRPQLALSSYSNFNPQQSPPPPSSSSPSDFMLDAGGEGDNTSVVTTAMTPVLQYVNIPVTQKEPEAAIISYPVPESQQSGLQTSSHPLDKLHQEAVNTGGNMTYINDYTAVERRAGDMQRPESTIVPHYETRISYEAYETETLRADTEMTMAPPPSSPCPPCHEPDAIEVGNSDNSDVVTVAMPLVPQLRSSSQRHEYEKDEEDVIVNLQDAEDTGPASVKLVRDSESTFKEFSGYMKEKWAELRLSKSGTKKRILKKKKYVPQKMKKKRYSQEDIALAATILYSSRRVYKLLKEKNILQLPSIRTVYRRLQHFNCHPGFNKQLFRLLEMKLATLNEKDRVLGISFDEMHLEQKYSWSPLLRRLFGKHKKAQVVMVRGMRRPWKMAIFYDFDIDATMDFVNEIIIHVEEAGGRVKAATCDMGNQSFLGPKGINLYASGNHCFPNPSRPTEMVWVIPDAVHMIKLFRNHIWRYGLVYKDGEVEEHLDKKDFEEAFKRDGVTGEIRLLCKFGLSHINAKKNELQRVYLAVQSLNDSMSCKFKLLGWDVKAKIIQIIDRWFHICDSRSKEHSKPFKAALGTHIEEQLGHLEDMIQLMGKIKFKGGHVTKPFQKGIVAGCKSIMALYTELKNSGQDYLCTYLLNQDALELHFSLIRSLVTHPRAAQFVSAYRALFFSSHTGNILEDNSPVSVTQDIWEPSWNEGLGLVDDPPEDSECVFLDVDDEVLMEECPSEQRSPSDQMQTVAGWISYKAKLPMREPEEGSWLQLRGRRRAMDDIEGFVERLDRAFNRFHKGTCGLKVGQNMVNKTIEFISSDSKCKDIPEKVRNLFVKCKFYMRIRDLNEELKHGNVNPNPEETAGQKTTNDNLKKTKTKNNKSYKTPRDLKKLAEQLF